MEALISTLKQTFPGKPDFSLANLPDLASKVVIVTGATAGVGKELAKILYSKNANIYVMARSEEKSRKAIDDIKRAVPSSGGKLAYVHLDLADLPTVKAAAEEFLRREQRLDILFNNAGLGYPERGSKTKQGYELVLGVNCVGPFLLTRLLTPVLVSTAALPMTKPGSVRVAWVSSSAAEAANPATFMQLLAKWDEITTINQYFYSKLGNYLHSTEFAARHRADGVVSASLNPGHLDSEFWSTQRRLTIFLLRRTVLHPTVYGAYTAVFAGLSPQLTLDNSGAHIAPWGRLWKPPTAMMDAGKRKSEGGTGIASEFWDWSEEQIKPYL